MMDKQILRKNARQRRALITPEAREEYAVMAAENAVLLLEKAKASVPMIYVATPEELGTWPLMDRLLDRGYYPVFPVMSGEEIIPVMWDEETVFVSNEKGILEPMGGTKIAPEEVDFVIVPGLSFDEQGHRLGRGGGFYDRFLADLPALRVGYCFQTQMTREIETEPHDIDMDYICTEIYTYDCAKNRAN